MMKRRLRHPPLDVEIVISDVSKEQSKVDGVLGEDYLAKVYRKGNWPLKSEWLCITDEFYDRLHICKQHKTGINCELALFLTREVTQAKATQVRDAKGLPLRDTLGGLILILHRSGCHVYMTHDKIAQKYGFCRPFITEQLNLLKEWGFIVNFGHGWIEFDCNLVWRGKLDWLSGYRRVQRIHEQLVELYKKANDFFATNEG